MTWRHRNSFTQLLCTYVGPLLLSLCLTLCSLNTHAQTGLSKRPIPPTYPPFGVRPGGTIAPKLPPGDTNADCHRLTGRYFSKPRVSIYRVDKTGNFFNDKFKVEGEIEGVCLVEAGYFSRGRKRQSIPIKTSRDFQRYPFALIVEGNTSPEIRAYNVNGDSDVIRIDPNDY